MSECTSLLYGLEKKEKKKKIVTQFQITKKINTWGLNLFTVHAMTFAFAFAILIWVSVFYLHILLWCCARNCTKKIRDFL